MRYQVSNYNNTEDSIHPRGIVFGPTEIVINFLNDLNSFIHPFQTYLSSIVPGLVICLVLSVLSAAAGIATEWIMKKSNLKTDPLHRYLISIIQ